MCCGQWRSFDIGVFDAQGTEVCGWLSKGAKQLSELGWGPFFYRLTPGSSVVPKDEACASAWLLASSRCGGVLRHPALNYFLSPSLQTRRVFQLQVATIQWALWRKCGVGLVLSLRWSYHVCLLRSYLVFLLRAWPSLTLNRWKTTLDRMCSSLRDLAAVGPVAKISISRWRGLAHIK